MAFDWNDYFTLAGELNSPGNEAKIRSAISRSYYCAFNLAKAYLFKEKGKFKYQDHEDLWIRFADYDDDRVSIESWGNRIRLIRNSADYDNEMKDMIVDHRTTIKYTFQIIEELNKPLPPQA